MKRLFACFSLIGLTACTIAPSSDVVDRIKEACVIDSTIRPVVMALTFLATPEEMVAITTAHSIIDPICANPSGSIASNTLTILANNIGRVQGILATLQARKSAQ